MTAVSRLSLNRCYEKTGGARPEARMSDMLVKLYNGETNKRCCDVNVTW
jgi:hypothetical protein